MGPTSLFSWDTCLSQHHFWERLLFAHCICYSVKSYCHLNNTQSSDTRTWDVLSVTLKELSLSCFNFHHYENKNKYKNDTAENCCWLHAQNRGGSYSGPLFLACNLSSFGKGYRALSNSSILLVTPLKLEPKQIAQGKLGQDMYCSTCYHSETVRSTVEKATVPSPNDNLPAGRYQIINTVET